MTHTVGDILKDPVGDNHSFDGIISWSVILHIENKQLLFQKCADLLPATGGGKLFSDDFYMMSPFTKEEEASLEKHVFAFKLPTKEEYIQVLETVGFTDVVFEDRTQECKSFVNDRLNKFIASRERFVHVNSPLSLHA